MDRWSELTAFVAVVEEGGFAPAAKRLKIAPSGVSRLISGLESRLSVRLLQRTTRRVSATEEGLRFYERSRDLLEGLAEAEAEVAGQKSTPRGHLRVACVVTLAERWMPPILADFMARCPEVSVELRETDRPVDLMAEEVDVALVTGPQKDSSYVARRLSGFQRMVVAAPAYLAAHGQPDQPADLKSHNCLAFANAPHLQRWSFQGGGGKASSLRVKGSFSANGAETILRASLAGIGICRLASFMVMPHLRSGALVELLADYRVVEPVPLYALYGPGRPLAPKLRVFLDHLAASFHPLPPWEADEG